MDVLGCDGLVPFALNDVELEGVRRAVAVGYHSTDTVARLLATVDVLRQALAAACEQLEETPDAVDA